MIFINQENELNFTGDNQVIYFYASWMPFHKKMMIILNKMEEKYNNIKFYAVDIDFFKSLCVRFSVSSIPTIILFKNGKKNKVINGVALTSAFKNIFADIYNK